MTKAIKEVICMIRQSNFITYDCCNGSCTYALFDCWSPRT